MLSVAVHKDVAEYQPKVISKLTLRTLVCIVGGSGSALLASLYLYFVWGLLIEDFMYVAMIVALPFWAAGFIRPAAMKLEEFIPLYLEHKLTRNVLLHTTAISRALNSPEIRAQHSAQSKRWKKISKMHGIEAWEIGQE